MLKSDQYEWYSDKNMPQAMQESGGDWREWPLIKPDVFTGLSSIIFMFT